MTREGGGAACKIVYHISGIYIYIYIYSSKPQTTTIYGMAVGVPLVLGSSHPHIQNLRPSAAAAAVWWPMCARRVAAMQVGERCCNPTHRRQIADISHEKHAKLFQNVFSSSFGICHAHLRLACVQSEDCSGGSPIVQIQTLSNLPLRSGR